jgi:leader peptidase (prepilin peptidase) / N-methyltransferase
MEQLCVVLSGVLGLLVGSFLNVVIWRVPRGESVVSPPSACPGCGSPVRPRDNVPVLSWLLLRGRCRDCAEPISPRYPLVELATAAGFAVVAAFIGPSWELPAFLYLLAISIALALIDIDVHRLPNAIVLPAYGIGAVLLAVPSLVAGDTGQLARLVAGMALLYGLYFLLAVAHPAGMGFGDVKLAGVLGMYLAWIGWSELGVGAFLAFLVGGVFGIALMLVRRAGRKSRIPFGPFMLLGAWGGIFFGDELVRSYLDALGL